MKMGETKIMPSRKRKRILETENSEVSSEKKAKSFCCRSFRQELREGSEVLKSLKRFIAATKASDEVVYEYLECGGSLQEILSFLDVTAAGDLTTSLPVFEVVHLILLRCQSADSKYHERCIESARVILHSHMLTIKAMLSMNVTKHKKVALKVLTAMATLDSSFANEIMNVVALSPPLITDLIQPSSEKESVRHCFILFVLSFLIEGNLTVVRNLLDKKGLLSSIIPGLKFDEAATVNLTLSLFGDKILKNPKITKTLKLKIFNTQIIKSLFDLYDWRGPQGIKQVLPRQKNKVKEVEVNQNEKDIVIESVHSFLLLLCCSHKYGVAFCDKLFGMSDQLNNQLLLTVFESLPDPLKTRKIAEILLKTIVNCLDIMNQVLIKLEPSFQPRNSKNWFQVMDFAENLVKDVNAAIILKAEAETPTANELIKVAKTLCAPVTLLKICKSGSLKSEAIEIRFRCLRLMAIIWKEAEKLIGACKTFQLELKKSLQKHIVKSVLDAEDLIELWHSLCDPEFFSSLPFSQEKRIEFMFAVLESLHIVLECQRGLVSSPLNLASDLLLHVELIKMSMSDGQFEDIQVKIVKLIEVDLQSLTTNMDLFEKSLRILFRANDDSSLSYLSKILATLEVFAGNKAEIDVWLLSYKSIEIEHRASVADHIVKALLTNFKKKAVISKDMSGSDSFRTTEESLVPLVFNCVELLKSHSSKSSKKDEKLLNFRYYLDDVIIHLQFFYGVEIYLYEQLKEFSKILGKSTLNFLKAWQSTCTVPVDSDVLRCPSEVKLILWIMNGEDNTRSAKEIVDVSNTDLLRLYSLFRIVVAYFIKKSVNGELSQNDVDKFNDALPLFLCHPPEDDSEDLHLISFDHKNGSVYQRNCLNCLFQNKHLFSEFDVFQKKTSQGYLTTKVILKTLMKRELIRNPNIKSSLTESWKHKFLERLKSKLKKKKSIEGLHGLERALEFFDYNQKEVTEMIKLLVSVSDITLFVNEDSPSAWTMILSKFIKLHCEKKEFMGTILNNLCLIMKHLNEKCQSGTEEVTDCFVRLLREHPPHLQLIDNVEDWPFVVIHYSNTGNPVLHYLYASISEFLDVFLSKTHYTSTDVILGKLLLNDPKKVCFLLKILPEKLETFKNPEIAFVLLSTLIVSEDSLLDIITFQENRSLWHTNEICLEKTGDLYSVLETVYNKFEVHILHAMFGEKENFILQNLDFTRYLVKLFLDKKKISKMKKEILRGKFNPKLLYEVIKKVNASSTTERYLRGLLTMFCQIIKKEEEGTAWEEYSSIVLDILQLNKDSTWQTVIAWPEWKELAKLVIGHCFGSMKDSPLLKIFRLLITALYKSEEDAKDCAWFFQMVISHSQFLRIMLNDSPLKRESVELFRCLIKRCPSEISPKHFPILLASYNAGLSSSDATILEILKLYEKSGVGVSSYEPYIWGDAAVSHYSVGSSPRLSLWQRLNMKNVLDLLDDNRLELSLKEFPLSRSLEGNENNNTIFEADIYDPAFLLPLFVNLLSPGAVVYSLSFIYKGGLAYAIRALSSECKDVRLIASVILTRFYSHLELSRNLKQKLVWMHFINRLRFGIKDLSVQPLPNIATLFLAKTTLELSDQPAEMYLPLQNFLLAKSYFVFDTIPEFLPLFHSSDVSYWKHREWLLKILRDGTKTSLDISVIFHTMALKVLFCSFYTQLCDVETKKLILQVLKRMLRVEKSVILISEYGLLSWINAMELGSCQSFLYDLLELLLTLTRVIKKDIKFQKNKNSNKAQLIQILNIAVKLLPSLNSLRSLKVFKVYLKVIIECVIFFVQEGQSDWFSLNSSSLSDILDLGTVLLGEKYDYRKFSMVPFYFRNFDEQCNCEIGQDLRNCAFLFSMLVNREVNGRNISGRWL